MYYALSFYPRLNEKLAESIDAIRRKHDPTFGRRIRAGQPH
jgi:hypothetical protein